MYTKAKGSKPNAVHVANEQQRDVDNVASHALERSRAERVPFAKRRFGAVYDSIERSEPFVSHFLKQVVGETVALADACPLKFWSATAYSFPDSTRRNAAALRELAVASEALVREQRA
eukprot:572380-Prymnesium_polylepis.1